MGTYGRPGESSASSALSSPQLVGDRENRRRSVIERARAWRPTVSNNRLCARDCRTTRTDCVRNTRNGRDPTPRGGFQTARVSAEKNAKQVHDDTRKTAYATDVSVGARNSNVCGYIRVYRRTRPADLVDPLMFVISSALPWTLKRNDRFDFWSVISECTTLCGMIARHLDTAGNKIWQIVCIRFNEESEIDIYKYIHTHLMQFRILKSYR